MIYRFWTKTNAFFIGACGALAHLHFVAGLAMWPAGAAAQGAAPPATVTVAQALAIDPAAAAMRSIAPADAFAAALAKHGFVPPVVGQADVPASDGKPRVWRPVTLTPEGTLRDAGFESGGWLYLAVQSSADQVVLLDAAGNASAWINGTPRVGDIYSDGYVQLPVKLRAGLNHIVLRGGRGPLKLRWQAAPQAPALIAADATLPDPYERQPAARRLGALIVLNPLELWSEPLQLRVRVGDGAVRAVAVPPLPPLSLRKVAVDFDSPALKLRGGVDALHLHAELHDARGRTLSQQRYAMKVKELADARRVTFRSGIDGSVQYYGLRLADSSVGWGPARPGLIVAQHGAAVEGVDLAASFAAKPWAHVVAPTNRRRFGFAWEEWGRLDLLEVLGDATATLAPDPDRVWLMGHSMGGHGTWINGTLLADRFAAFAPVAGWATIWSYANAPRPQTQEPVQAVLRRAGNVSDAPEMLPNLNSRGLFILHPGDDESVPPAESHRLLPLVAQKHRDFAYQERPGAIHWWGNTVVDWPPLQAFLQARRRPAPAEQGEIEFVTPDPAISASFAWLTVAQQRVPLEFSRVRASAATDARQLRITTANVQTLGLNLAELAPRWTTLGLPASAPVSLEIDGQKLTLDGAQARYWLGRTDTRSSAAAVWQIASAPPPGAKGPGRGGRFQDAFRHDMVFVVGTRGSPEENRWALDKARFDAELFWYRGNGGVRVVRDTDFRAAEHARSNLILYGNADTHAQWSVLLADSPIQVRRGEVAAGGQTLRGDELAAVFIRPKPGTADRSIGVVAATGARGGLVADRLPWWVPGVGFPDWLIASPAVFDSGWNGIRGAGFFDNDWRYSAEDSAFNPR